MLGELTRAMIPELAEAYEVVVEGEGTSPIVLCCEHASNHRPNPWGEDRWLEHTHWAWDPGAGEMARDLAAALGSRGVLARFSRLLVDANRPLYSSTLFRDRAEDRVVHTNDGLPDSERYKRIQRWYQPYHDALDATLAAHPATTLLSIHSFSPVYEGQTREVEVGVLFESDDALAADLIEAMRPSGLDVRSNEPYSGKGGMMYSCYHHAAAHGMAALELEFRQDLLAEPGTRKKIFDATLRSLEQVLLVRS